MIATSPHPLDDDSPAPNAPRPMHAIGIDLGTTRSSVAYVAESGRTEMLPNQHDEVFTPSVILFDGDERIVGREAVRQTQLLPDQIAYEVKRDMGQRFYSRPILDRQLPPEVIQACVLRSLRGDIRRRLKGDYQAVITVPAYFDESRRTSTLAAGKMAELNVLDIVNEPTAAALAFGERLGYLRESGEPRGAMTLLVYDLGGGTFDCTIVRLAQGQITTIATDGDMRLGGSDWDQRLLTLAIRKLRNQHGIADEAMLGLQPQLMRLVVDAKHTLSTRNEAALRLDVKGRAIVLNVTRNEFEQQTADLVERTAFTTRQVLEAAGAKWSTIDRLLLVGGATRMPMVRQMLEVASGKTVDTTVNPDEAVARGAAIFAEYQLGNRGVTTAPSGLTITDVNAHTLGIEGIDLTTKIKQNTHIIPRNTPLPCVVHRKFVTKRADQRTVVIQVLEGESKSLDGVIRLGRAVIRNLPPNLPAKHPINVEYRYNTNGQLEVRAQVVGHGETAHIELQRTRDLSDTSIAAWKQVVCDDGGFNDFESVMRNLIENDSAEYSPDDLLPTPAAKADSVLAYRLGDSGTVDGLSADSGLLDDTKPLVSNPEDRPVGEQRDSPRLEPTSGEEDDRWRAEDTNVLPIDPSRLKLNSSAAVAIPPKRKQPSFREELTAPQKAMSNKRKKNSGSGRLLVTMVGHVLASILGLAMGYYLLVLFRPEANVLNLTLPGLPPAAESRLDQTESDETDDGDVTANQGLNR